jgi:uncharacterized radical SAM superfamily Fe-S cluster-containing enzyme
MSDGLVQLSSKKRGLAVVTPPPPPWEAVGAFLRALDEPAARRTFDVQGRALKTTASLCPQCLAHVPALVFEQGGRVFARKLCPSHGPALAVLENDVAYYRLSSRDGTGRVFARELIDDHGDVADGACCADGACTPQGENVTCTLLVEITNACNLACRVCYADSRGDRVMPLPEVTAHLTRILDARGRLDSVQITGGEASLHPQFREIVAWLHAEPRVKKIYLPTNGLLLSRDADWLVAFRDKLIVLLQFDTVQGEANRPLRAADPQKPRLKVIEDLARLGVFLQLTMTIARGTNEDDVADVVQLALRHDHVKVVALQPATSSGRYDLPLDPLDRATLSDVVKAVRSPRVDPAHFVPIPCSHPNCGWITLFFRRFGLVENLTRHVDLAQKRPALTNKALLSTDELRDVVGTQTATLLDRVKGAIGRRVVRSQDVFTVAVKPFMDKHTYDQDRIATCCHHLMDTRGNVTSFCEYNALLRPADSWERFPVLPAATSR